MKHVLLISFLLLVLIVACDQPKTNQSLEEQQVTTILNQFHGYFDNKDFRSLSALCTDDMFWYALNGQAVSKTLLPGFFLPIMSNWKSANTTLADLEFEADGTVMVVRYKSQIDIVTSTGDFQMNNLHSTVFKKMGTDWKIWQHHMSTK